MSRLDPLREERAARDRARAEFSRRLALAKLDLAPEVLKRRAVTEVQQTARTVAYQAIDIANDSRGIVVATVATLVLWLARRQVTTGLGSLLQQFQRRRSANGSVRGRVNAMVENYWQRLKEYADD